MNPRGTLALFASLPQKLAMIVSKHVSITNRRQTGIRHYHPHVLPRHHNDNLNNIENGELMDVKEKAACVCSLRPNFSDLYTESPAPWDALPYPESVTI